MKDEKTAIQFFKEIEKEKEKYKLINGLFIVKYLEKDISIFIGYFHKRGCAFNEGVYNKIKISYSTHKQLFNKKTHQTLINNFWKPLNIAFKEQPINKILE